MSAAVEAAAMAILDAEIARGGGLPGDLVRWEHKGEARAALAAALPHLTEGLAELLQKHSCEYGDCACGWVATLYGESLAKHQAAAIEAELYRKIES